MSDAARTPVEERIALLLRKAEKTDNPHEAEAFSEAAEKLMLKHGIELAMINLDTDKPEEIVTDASTFWTGTYAMDTAHQSMHVIDAMGCKSFFIDHTRWGVYHDGQVRRGVTVKVVGFESDVRDAVNLARSLQLQSQVALKVWARGSIASWWSPSEKYLARQSFISGFGVGAGSRIRANRQKIIVEEMPTGTDLVLVDRAAKIDAWVDENLDTVTQKPRRVDLMGATAGHRAGTDAVTGERGITAGRAIER